MRCLDANDVIITPGQTVTKSGSHRNGKVTAILSNYAVYVKWDDSPYGDEVYEKSEDLITVDSIIGCRKKR